MNPSLYRPDGRDVLLFQELLNPTGTLQCFVSPFLDTPTWSVTPLSLTNVSRGRLIQTPSGALGSLFLAGAVFLHGQRGLGLQSNVTLKMRALPSFECRDPCV